MSMVTCIVQTLNPASLAHKKSADIIGDTVTQSKQMMALPSHISSCQCSFRRATADIQITLRDNSLPF